MPADFQVARSAESSRLERAAGYLPAAVALALPIVFIPNLGDSYILPRAAIVIAGACLGTALALLMPTRQGLGALRWPLAGAAVAAVLAFVFSTNWALSFAGSYLRYESLPVRLGYLGLLASSAWLLRDDRQRKAVVAAFVAGCSLAALQAIQQHYSHAPFRPYGDLGNATLLAAVLAMAVPIAVDRAWHARGWPIASWSAAIVTMVAGLWFTTSRSGFLGLGVACLVLVVFSVRPRFALVATLVSAALGAAALAYIYISPLRRLNGDPPELRLHLWGDGLRLIEARPLTGWGEDTTGLVFGHYLRRGYEDFFTFDRIHSGPLDLAATQGVLGLAATGLVLGIVFLAAWRRRSITLVPGLAAAIAGYSVWVLFNFDWVPATGAFWLLAGALWSAAGASTPPVTVRVRHTWRYVGALALVAATAVLAVLPVLADSWYGRGRPDIAVRENPFLARYHWSIGTIAELRRASELGETEPSMYVQLGDQERNMGDIDAARRDFERALAIDPYSSIAKASLVALPDAPAPP